MKAFNQHYFDNIDTPEKSYWLGFITADGCFRDNGRFALGSIDREHLVKFRECLNSKHAISESDGFFQINIPAHRWQERLKDFGIIPRKTYTDIRWTMQNKRLSSKQSRYRGVRPERGMFKAIIKINKQSHYLGWFANEIDAARAYDAAVIGMGLARSWNFPDGATSPRPKEEVNCDSPSSSLV